MNRIDGSGIRKAVEDLQSKTAPNALETSNRNAEKIIKAIKDSGGEKVKNPSHLGKKFDTKI